MFNNTVRKQWKKRLRERTGLIKSETRINNKVIENTIVQCGNGCDSALRLATHFATTVLMNRRSFHGGWLIRCPTISVEKVGSLSPQQK